MNVEIFEHESYTKLQDKINKWLDEYLWDENADQCKEVVDIKLVTDDNRYVAMIIYKYI